MTEPSQAVRSDQALTEAVRRIVSALAHSVDGDVMNIEEAATFLRVGLDTMRKVAKAGKVPTRKIGREYRFSRSGLIAFLSSGNSVPNENGAAYKRVRLSSQIQDLTNNKKRSNFRGANPVALVLKSQRTEKRLARQGSDGIPRPSIRPRSAGKQVEVISKRVLGHGQERNPND